MKIVVLADTHIPTHAPGLPAELMEPLRRADGIIHAGDVTNAAVLDELNEYAPVHAVIGNNDGPDVARWGATDELVIDLGDFRVGVVHDSGPRRGRERRLLRRFPDARVIVFGHSHIPMAYEDQGVLLVNPGSPTWKRREPHPTYAILEISESLPTATIVAIL
jgi:putative phosphoesterase